MTGWIPFKGTPGEGVPQTEIPLNTMALDPREYEPCFPPCFAQTSSKRPSPVIMRHCGAFSRGTLRQKRVKGHYWKTWTMFNGKPRKQQFTEQRRTPASAAHCIREANSCTSLGVPPWTGGPRPLFSWLHDFPSKPACDWRACPRFSDGSCVFLSSLSSWTNQGNGKIMLNCKHDAGKHILSKVSSTGKQI